MPRPRSPQALFACLFLASACSSGLGSDSSVEAPTPASPRGTGIGIDFGFGSDGAGGERSLSLPVGSDYALAAALIPAAGGAPPRRISFVGFTTASPADDADGAGGLLSTAPSPPSDANGASDVFLAAMDDGLAYVDGRSPQPRAFSQGLMPIFQHSRCVHCHGIREGADGGAVFPANAALSGGHPGGQVNSSNSDPENPGSNVNCAGCHDPNLAESGALDVEWFAPVRDEVALDFRGKTARELSERVEELELDEHLLNDSRVRWAIETGLVPSGTAAPMAAGSSGRWVSGGARVSQEGPVPVTMTEFEERLRAWEEGGHAPTAAGAIQSVALVSRTSAGNASNGASAEPSVAWVPSQSFDPDAGGQQIAGTVFVAFSSTATDLVSGASAPTSVYRAGFRVTVALDQPGAPLAFVPLDDAVRVSDRSAGSAANGSSFAPAMGGNGERIAFESLATNLVTGFTDGNGSAATDVFVRDVSTASGALGAVTLVSHAEGSATSGGAAPGAPSGPTDGASLQPAISFDGRYVAFASSAVDLVMGDANDLQDVFVTDLDGGAFVAAISVNGAGAPASGGPSGSPSVASFSSSGEFTVAFESEAPGLDPSLFASGRQVYLREEGVTRLLSRSPGAAGNGASFDPVMSPSGAEVFFTSSASNLGSAEDPDTNGVGDVFAASLVQLRRTGDVELRRINVDGFGAQSGFPASSPAVGSLQTSAGAPGGASFVLMGSSDPQLGATAEPLIAYFLEEAAPPLGAAFTTESPVTTAEGQIRVRFQNQSTGDPRTYRWDFGANPNAPTQSIGTSTAQNPSFLYTVPGVYDVTLTVSTGTESDVAVQTSLVELLAPLRVESLQASSLVVQESANTLFGATLSRDEGVSYLWDFGDGTTSAAREPNKAFSLVGIYDVTLRVSDEYGDDTSAPLRVEVVPDSSVGMIFDPDTQGLFWNFRFTGAPAISSQVQWDFDFSGDVEDPGATFSPELTLPSIAIAFHPYSATGTYLVAARTEISGTFRYSVQAINARAVLFEEVLDTLQTRCGSCHGGSSPSDGVTFSGPIDDVYGDLVGVSVSLGSSCSGIGGSDRVRRFSTSESFLYSICAASGSSCAGMTNVPSGPSLTLIEEWIRQGAALE